MPTDHKSQPALYSNVKQIRGNLLMDKLLQKDVAMIEKFSDYDIFLLEKMFPTC